MVESVLNFFQQTRADAQVLKFRMDDESANKASPFAGVRSDGAGYSSICMELEEALICKLGFDFFKGLV